MDFREKFLPGKVCQASEQLPVAAAESPNLEMLEKCEDAALCGPWLSGERGLDDLGGLNSLKGGITWSKFERV